jgi:hypothetical protein
MTWLRNLFDCRIEPYVIPLTLEREDSVATEQVMFPVLPPHEVFSAVWHAGDLQRQVSLFGESRSVAREFWAHAVQQPWGRLHPVAQNRSLDDLAKCIGVVFHVDGVEVRALLNVGFGQGELVIGPMGIPGGSRTVPSAYRTVCSQPAALLTPPL